MKPLIKRVGAAAMALALVAPAWALVIGAVWAIATAVSGGSAVAWVATPVVVVVALAQMSFYRWRRRRGEPPPEPA